MPTTLAGGYNAAVKPVIAGWRAADLLQQCHEGRVVAALAASIYIVVRGELLWLGGPGGVLHARAVRLAALPRTPCAAGDSIRLAFDPIAVWRPPLVEREGIAALRHGAIRLSKCATRLGAAAGFGARLAGGPLPFPLAAVASDADLLASACAEDDADRAAHAAERLLGVGGGLTPSGDDYVGGAFFARGLLARADAGDAASWRRAAERVRAAAASATHPISATVLGDLLDGEGWAPLHDLARALADGDERASEAAARSLTRLGHSSGWDVLAGFLAGIGT
jgi:hypothetical protein